MRSIGESLVLTHPLWISSTRTELEVRGEVIPVDVERDRRHGHSKATPTASGNSIAVIMRRVLCDQEVESEKISTPVRVGHLPW
jgi:hypothetical protein